MGATHFFNEAHSLLTPMQIKLARTALGWGRKELAEASGVSRATIKRIEDGNRAFADTVDALERTLRRHGCDFADDNWVKAP